MIKNELSKKNTEEILNLNKLLLESDSNWAPILNSIKIFVLNETYFNLFNNDIGEQIKKLELESEIIKDRNFETIENLSFNISNFFAEYDYHYNFDITDHISISEDFKNKSYETSILTFLGIMISGMIITLFIIFLAEGIRKNYNH